MLQNIEACEWLTGALRSLEAPSLDPSYASIRAVYTFSAFFSFILSDSFYLLFSLS